MLGATETLMVTDPFSRRQRMRPEAAAGCENQRGWLKRSIREHDTSANVRLAY